MKNYIIYFMLGIVVVVAACQSDDEDETIYESTAVIMGADVAMCACCGGFVIVIDDDGIDYRFEVLPEAANIDLSEVTYPFAVKLNWHTDRECALINYITIDEIERY